MTRTNRFLFFTVFFISCSLIPQLCISQSSIAAGLVPDQSVSVILPKTADPVMKNIAQLLKRRVEERSLAKVSINGNDRIKIELSIEKGIGLEGFRIIDKKGRIQITGNDLRGVLFGVGKFLRSSLYTENGFIPGKWRGVSIPEKPVRGMYFAPHFENYYEAASLPEVKRYIEDIGLWGVNCLLFLDPFLISDKDSTRQRFQEYMRTARSIGMGIGMLIEGNAGYIGSPKEIRADPGGGRGGVSETNICPNKPGGLDYIRNEFSHLFDWLKEFQPEYIGYWPYDAGGCASADCQPWGSNGFVKCCKEISKIVRAKLPGTKIIVSTWYFDSTEWNGLNKQLKADQSWVDMVMVESPEFENRRFAPLAVNLPAVGFPEISMQGTFPWGGFGATPLVKHLEEQWIKLHSRLAGGFPYSEGIYEDLNKITHVQLCWNSQLPVGEILKEYISYEYSPLVVNEVVKAITIVEQNHHYRWWPGELDGVPLSLDWFPSKNAKPQIDPGAEDAYALVKYADTKLPERARGSWRWRILFIRAMLDAELKANGGSPNEKCIEGFKELMKIYHVNVRTNPGVRPPIPVPAIDNN